MHLRALRRLLELPRRTLHPHQSGQRSLSAFAARWPLKGFVVDEQRAASRLPLISKRDFTFTEPTSRGASLRTFPAHRPSAVPPSGRDRQTSKQPRPLRVRVDRRCRDPCSDPASRRPASALGRGPTPLRNAFVRAVLATARPVRRVETRQPTAWRRAGPLFARGNRGCALSQRPSFKGSG